jgi:ribosomal-protein-alanine N-acetyltransferase
MSSPRPQAGKVVARGPRVLLRYACPDDRSEFLALYRASRAFLAPWEPRVKDPTGRLRFLRLLEGLEAGTHHRLLLCRREDGRLLGCLGVSNVVRGVFQNATLGYWIGEEHRRRGYMREALAAALTFVFRRLRLHRVEINFMPSNRGSRALARGAGFSREGRSRRMLRIAGRWEDMERWALLAEDWRAQARKPAGRVRPERVPQRQRR